MSGAYTSGAMTTTSTTETWQERYAFFFRPSVVRLVHLVFFAVVMFASLAGFNHGLTESSWDIPIALGEATGRAAVPALVWLLFWVGVRQQRKKRRESAHE